LGALRARGKVLMLQSLLWDDEVREADFDTLKADVRVSEQELKMSSALVDNMATDFAPDKFSDDYQDQLKQLIAAKLEQGDALDTAATFGDGDEKPDEAEVIDLMEALRRSVEQNRSKRAGEQQAPSKETAAKKTAGKKTAAKKNSAKKTTSKKSASRDSMTKKSAKAS
jgi:DNA end-binding protein Ku